jgi:hypothetical protein
MLVGVIFSFVILLLGLSAASEMEKEEKKERQALKMILNDCPPYGSGRHDWSIDPVSMALVCTKCNTKAGNFND